MLILQQYLTAISNSKNDEQTKDNNKLASEMIKNIVSEIKKNQSTRIEGDLVHVVDFNNTYILPKTQEEIKNETKWSKFAMEKGIKKKKKSRMVYSEKLQKWTPRYGSRSEQNIVLQGGAVEVEQSMSKMIRDKKKRQNKNKERQEKNIKANKKNLKE